MTTTQDLRREAHGIAGSRPDAITTLTLDQRAAALLRFAELAIHDDFPADALPSCVVLLASPAVADEAMDRFEGLVEAVRDRQRFDAAPRDYAAGIDWPTSETALDALDEKLQGEIDGAVWTLLHPYPACVRCQRAKPMERWNPADWPRSRFCVHHNEADAS